MRLQFIKLVHLWAVCLAVPAAAKQAHFNASYTITEIGVLPGGGSTSAIAINAGGSVAGTADTGNAVRHGDYSTGANHNHALLWNNGRITDLPPPTGLLHAWAAGIDDDGRVVGYAATTPGDGTAQPVVWKDGAARVLPSLGGNYAAARGLAGNAFAGAATLRSGAQHACLWKDSRAIDLGTLNGGRVSDARAINRHGAIAGSSETVVWVSPTTRGHFNHACVWIDRKIRDLGALGGRESVAAAINEKGQVCGAWWPGTFTSRDGSKNLDSRGFMFDGRTMRDLGTLGGRNSEAHGLDDSGRVVGESETRRARDGMHAFLWSGHTMIDLNNLIPRNSGWVLVAARSINKRGQIVGDGLHLGKPRAFVLTPIDLPPLSSPSVQAPQGFPLQRRTNVRDGAEMIHIPAGDFVAGRSQVGRAVRKPLKGFYIYTNLVTVAQFRTFCRATGRPMPPVPGWVNDESKSPIVYVTQEEAEAYCRWADVSLPTDAQWEKAAWGDVDPATSTVSPYGVQDIRGVVWQWCRSDPEAAIGPAADRERHEQDAFHLRGGTWPWSQKGHLVPFGATNRIYSTGSNRNPSYGLRGVRNDP